MQFNHYYYGSIIIHRKKNVFERLLEVFSYNSKDICVSINHKIKYHGFTDFRKKRNILLKRKT